MSINKVSYYKVLQVFIVKVVAGTKLEEDNIGVKSSWYICLYVYTSINKVSYYKVIQVFI